MRMAIGYSAEYTYVPTVVQFLCPSFADTCVMFQFSQMLRVHFLFSYTLFKMGHPGKYINQIRQ